MFSWLNDLENKVQSLSRNDLLNEGLYLAMEWGEDWLKPIQERLAVRHPALSKEDLDKINAISQEAMRFGHGAVYDLALKSGDETSYGDFEPAMIAQYPWVDAKNLSRLFSQGMYYAWKDTGLR